MPRHDSGGAPAKHAAALAELEPVSAYPLGVSVPNLMLRISHGKPVEGAPSDLVASWPGIVRKLGLDRHRTYSDKLAARWLIGATSTTGRTTAGSFEQFAIAALDFDDNPPADLPARFAALGVDGAVFETWRSTPAAPRYRVLVPLSAPVSADHYPDVVLVIAYLLGALDSLDEHSLETARKMFVPSVPKGQTRPAPLVIAAGAYLDTAKVLELAPDAQAAYMYGSGAATLTGSSGAPHGASATVRALCQQFGGMTNAAIIDTMRATTEGSRHDSLVAASYVLAAHGATADEFEELTDAAVTAGLTEAEVLAASAGAASAGGAEFEATISKAFTPWTAEDDAAVERMIAAQASNSVRRRFPLTDLAALVDPDRPPRTWLLEDLIPDGDHVSLVAPAGVGKSLLVLSLSVDLARGADEFIGRRVDFDGRVMVVDMENSDDDLSERLTDLGVTPDNAPDIADRLLLMHLPPLAGLDTEQGAKDLLTVLDAYGLGKGDLLILDSTQRLTEGEENSNDTMRALYRRIVTPLKRLGITVIRTDNTGHSAGDRARGASAKKDDVGVSLLLKPADDPDLLTLETTKHRAKGAGAGTLRFRRESDDNGILRFVPITAANAAAGVGLASLLLDDLKVPATAGRRAAVNAVKAAKEAAEGRGESFPSVSYRTIEQAQDARKASAALIESFDDADDDDLEADE